MKKPILRKNKDRGTEGHCNGVYLWWKIKKGTNSIELSQKVGSQNQTSFEENNIYQ